MKMYLNERRVINIELAGINRRDYPDLVDAYAMSATWEDTGLPLTEDELNQLTDDLDFHEYVLNRLH